MSTNRQTADGQPRFSLSNTILLGSAELLRYRCCGCEYLAYRSPFFFVQCLAIFCFDWRTASKRGSLEMGPMC